MAGGIKAGSVKSSVRGDGSDCPDSKTSVPLIIDPGQEEQVPLTSGRDRSTACSLYRIGTAAPGPGSPAAGAGDELPAGIAC